MNQGVVLEDILGDFLITEPEGHPYDVSATFSKATVAGGERPSHARNGRRESAPRSVQYPRGYRLGCEGHGGPDKDSIQRSRRRRGLSQRRNVNKMMQQVQQMQQQMQQAQEELANETVTASAGGGAVKATMTGGMELVSIEIDPEVVDPEDVEMLQDMVLAAVNEAMTSSQELANKKLGGITGGLGDLGLNIPGL